MRRGIGAMIAPREKGGESGLEPRTAGSFALTAELIATENRNYPFCIHMLSRRSVQSRVDFDIVIVGGGLEGRAWRRRLPKAG